MIKEIRLCVVSHKRARNVPLMTEKCNPYEINWYVGKGYGKEYKDNGAKSVTEVDYKIPGDERSGNLVNARNKALDDSFKEDKVCVQMDDDLVRVELAMNSKIKREARVEKIIELMYQHYKKTKTKLIGVSPTSNAFFYNPKNPVSDKHFIVACLMMVAPNLLRMSPELTTKEDYDYTLQHISTYGEVARLNYILPSFQFKTGEGGVVSYRTDEVEHENIQKLLDKWGNLIRLNPRRKNEILIKV